MAGAVLSQGQVQIWWQAQHFGKAGYKCHVQISWHAPATKSVPDLAKVLCLSLTLRKHRACHENCTEPCESAAPATKSVPDLAKVPRLPRNLCLTVRKYRACHEIFAQPCESPFAVFELQLEKCTSNTTFVLFEDLELQLEEWNRTFDQAGYRFCGRRDAITLFQLQQPQNRAKKHVQKLTLFQLQLENRKR